MSFNQDIKNEIINSSKEKDFRFSLLTGFLRLGGQPVFLGENKIKLTVISYNPSIARFIKKELKELFSIDSKLEIKKNKLDKYFYTLKLNAAQEKLLILYRYLELLDASNDFKDIFMIKTPSFIKSSKRSLKGYLTGLFLAKGVVVSPAKAYLYSIENLNKKNAEDIKKLFSKFDLNIKININKYQDSYNVVCCRADNILDILAMMGLSKSYTFFENIVIQKQNKAMANRQRNMELVNITKTTEASGKQIKNILMIKNKIGLDSLPEKIKTLAEKRLENEDLSLARLAELFDTSRHTIYSRFKKIEEIAGGLDG